MFFSKKTPKQEFVEQRSNYRKRQSAGDEIAVHLITPSGTYQGEFRDISVQGVGASFRIESDPNLAEDDVVEVAVRCDMRAEICTPARAVYGQIEDGTRVRYGLEFINVGNLYSQLDSFYARIFNRRGSPRVRPTLHEKVLMRIGWRSNELDAMLSEVSATGAGITLPITDAYQLQGIERLRVAFELPGVPRELRGEARIEKRKQTGKHAILGLSFDFDAGGTLASMAAELAAFVDRRMAEMESWEAGGR